MRYLATAFILCLITACSPSPEEENPSLDPSQYHGRWLVVNYWAEWCQPCREEIPELNRLARENPELIAVLGVNFDGLQGEALQTAIANMAIEFPSTGVDPSLPLKQPRPRMLPTTLVFNPEGKLQQTLLGPQTYEKLVELINLQRQP